MSEREHGYARYKLDGCRCNICGWAVAQYNDAREHAIRCGEWQPYVDAEPVRQHLVHLRACGMGLRAIAAAAGVDRKRLQAVTAGRPERGTGPQVQVRPALAAAVLAVEPTLDTIAPATPVDATGTHRRLQALVASGWPHAFLADELGMTPGNFSTFLRRERVLVRHVRAVREVYDRLWRVDPLEYGASAGGVTRARRYAAERGWAPVGAWDDDAIDDLAAVPDWTGRCGTPEGYAAHRRAGLLPACAPCRAALNERQREQKRRRRAAQRGAVVSR